MKKARLAALHLAGWTVLALLSASQIILTYTATGGPVAVRTVLILSLISWYSWAVVSPTVLYAAIRLPLRGPYVARNILGHVLFNLLLAALVGLLYRQVRDWLDLPVRNSYWTMLLSTANIAVLVYWGLVALAHVTAATRASRERERRATQIARQLAEARLDALRAQIHPHFLFNTLHAVAGHVRVDARGAEDMLAQLADLLRITLDTSPTHEVPLAAELEIADRYLAIQQTRFGDRLRFVKDIAPDVLAARVPVMVLQPLLENAIEHGIALRRAGGTLYVRAVRADGAVMIEVTNDGPETDEIQLTTQGRGLGLSNSRARLEGLYGNAASLAISRPSGGTTQVSIRLPYREAIEATAAV